MGQALFRVRVGHHNMGDPDTQALLDFVTHLGRRASHRWVDDERSFVGHKHHPAMEMREPCGRSDWLSCGLLDEPRANRFEH